jgi:hypothetical protein
MKRFNNKIPLDSKESKQVQQLRQKQKHYKTPKLYSLMQRNILGWKKPDADEIHSALEQNPQIYKNEGIALLTAYNKNVAYLNSDCCSLDSYDITQNSKNRFELLDPSVTHSFKTIKDKYNSILEVMIFSHYHNKEMSLYYIVTPIDIIKK